MLFLIFFFVYVYIFTLRKNLHTTSLLNCFFFVFRETKCEKLSKFFREYEKDGIEIERKDTLKR